MSRKCRAKAQVPTREHEVLRDPDGEGDRTLPKAVRALLGDTETATSVGRKARYHREGVSLPVGHTSPLALSLTSSSHLLLTLAV